MKYYEQASTSSRVLPCAFTALSLGYAAVSLVLRRIPDACIAGVVFAIAAVIALQSFAVVCFDEIAVSYRQFFRKKTIPWNKLRTWSPRSVRAGGGTAQMVELFGCDGTHFTLLQRRELMHALQKYAKSAYAPAPEKDTARNSK